MTPFYVHVIGPYDNTFFGTFDDYAEARHWAAGIPSNFDAYVYSHEELKVNFAQFGERPIEEAY